MAKIKLSTAIRRGMKIYPRKANGKFFAGSKSACTLGCAYAGISKKHAKHTQNMDDIDILLVGSELFKEFPQLAIGVTNQELLYGSPSLRHLIEHMNDNLKWSRKKIVGWLEDKGF